MGSSIAWAILSLLTIFSTVFAIYTWVAGKKRKQLSISCRTNEIIIEGKSNIDKLQIRYDGQDIADLSCTKFYIWNSGNTVLNTSDIVSSRPICIKNTGSAVILNAEIVRVSDETNSFVIKSANEQSVEISFDYVDHGEGFVMQILHSGDSKDLEIVAICIGIYLKATEEWRYVKSQTKECIESLQEMQAEIFEKTKIREGQYWYPYTHYSYSWADEDIT